MSRMRELIRSYVNLLKMTSISQPCQQYLFIQSTTYTPAAQWSVHSPSSLSHLAALQMPLQQQLSQELQVFTGKSPCLIPPTAGFQDPSSQQNDNRAEGRGEKAEI